MQAATSMLRASRRLQISRRQALTWPLVSRWLVGRLFSRTAPGAAGDYIAVRRGDRQIEPGSYSR